MNINGIDNIFNMPYNMQISKRYKKERYKFMLAALTFTIIDWNSSLLDMTLRLVVATLCGFAIGFERKTRSKEAGIRTHAIVALAAALMMVISKYGFPETPGRDAARIAAQVVSGIGFLGAGIIFYRRDMLHGLTTAAGIWATAGIGMAIGAGMVATGIICSTLLLLLQIFLHRPIRLFRGRIVTILRMYVKLENDETVDTIHYMFSAKKFLKFKTTNNNGDIFAEIELFTDKTFTAKEIYEIINNNPFIINLERTDEI